MKKLLTIICVFSLFAVTAQEKKQETKEEKQQRYIQEGNPFKEFGYKPKIATLSKGKYREFFTDTIVQIGSFTYNRVSKNITGVIIIENKGISEADLRPDLVSRWFSPDPLSSEFPDVSPYNFVNNNPIRFIDPTGLAPEDIILGKNEVANRDLNQDEINELLGGLQSITDDKLRYNSETGRVEIAEQIDGDKTSGTGLIRNLINGDKNVTINVNKDGNIGMIGGASGASDEANMHNETNGVGTDVTVNVGIGHNIFTQAFGGGNVTENSLTTQGILNHELIHSLVQTNGQAKRDSKSGRVIYYTDNNGVQQKERIPNEEAFTLQQTRTLSNGIKVPNENTLRREQKLRRRVNYFKARQIKQ